MGGDILLVCVYVFVPALLILLVNKVKFFNKIGAVLLAYAVGLFLGNTGLIHYAHGYESIQEYANSLTIPLALPLLLFSLDIRSWFSMVNKAMLALLTGLFSVIIMVTVGYLLFQNGISDAWKVAGMLIGVYSGGTPNLAAIQSALNVDAATYLMVNTVDIVLSSIFLLIIMTFGKVVLRKFLPKYLSQNQTINDNQLNVISENYDGILSKKGFVDVLKGFGMSVLIVGLSIGLSFLLVGDISMLILILAITSFSIVASLWAPINKLLFSFQSGMYLILIFCIVVASMANLKEMGQIAFELLAYLSVVVFGSLLLHILLAKLFKIDADTILVTSAALICSPPFVPVVAGALKNKEVIISGLTVGIIGYAVGNYLGVSIAYLLKAL